MAAFDAELYLRLAAERLVLAGVDPRRPHEASPVTVAAQALVAVGAIDDATAVAVLEDYVLASAVRGDMTSLHSLSDDFEDEEAPPTVAIRPLTPARVVSCDRDLQLASGTLHVSHVTLGREVTTLAGVLRLATAAARPRRGPTLRAHGSRHSLTLTDDRGTRLLAQFSGGGSETLLQGHFDADPGLHVDTAYIEVDGQRIDLEGEVEAAEVWIEPLPDQRPAFRYLWQCVTPEGHMRETPTVEPAIDALVAAGALAADDPVLDELRAVAATMTREARLGMQNPGAAPLPEPWRSVSQRSSRKGPAGTVAVRAATPVFDGFAVAVSAVQSDEESWTAEVEVAPALEMFSPFDPPRARSRPLAWWAADDRGHHFLGAIGSWSGGDDLGRGTIHFAAALDPKAAYIDLLPTATTHRAVIRVPLEWP